MEIFGFRSLVFYVDFVNWICRWQTSIGIRITSILIPFFTFRYRFLSFALFRLSCIPAKAARRTEQMKMKFEWEKWIKWWEYTTHTTQLASKKKITTDEVAGTTFNTKINTKYWLQIQFYSRRTHFTSSHESDGVNRWCASMLSSLIFFVRTKGALLLHINTNIYWKQILIIGTSR